MPADPGGGPTGMTPRNRRDRPPIPSDGRFMNQPIKNLQDASSSDLSQSAKPRSGRRWTVWACIIAVLLIAGLVWWNRQGAAPQERTGRNSGPMSIVPEVVGKGDIGISINALGTVSSLATVTVRTQISGYLQKIDFTEGTEVKKGDLLA